MQKQHVKGSSLRLTFAEIIPFLNTIFPLFAQEDQVATRDYLAHKDLLMSDTLRTGD
jgi:hypothetical protein